MIIVNSLTPLNNKNSIIMRNPDESILQIYTSNWILTILPSEHHDVIETLYNNLGNSKYL